MKLILVLICFIQLTVSVMNKKKVSLDEIESDNAYLPIRMPSELTIEIKLDHGPNKYWRLGNRSKVERKLVPLNLDNRETGVLYVDPQSGDAKKGIYHFEFETVEEGFGELLFQLMTGENKVEDEKRLSFVIKKFSDEL